MKTETDLNRGGAEARRESLESIRWRQQSAPWWRKHRRAERNMMRWMWRVDVTRRANKVARRLRKWMNEYERTILRMPEPPAEKEIATDETRTEHGLMRAK